MYSTLKTTTLERKFPLLAVEQGCIVSKEADITVAFRVELPELFTVAGEDYINRTGLSPSGMYPRFRRT